MATNTVIITATDGFSGTIAAIISGAGGSNYDDSQPVQVDCYSKGEDSAVSTHPAGGGFDRKTFTPNPAHEFSGNPNDGEKCYLINSTLDELVARAWNGGFDGPGTPGYGDTGDLFFTGGLAGADYDSDPERHFGGGGGCGGPDGNGENGEDGTIAGPGVGGAGGGGLAGAGGLGRNRTAGSEADAENGGNYGGGAGAGSQSGITAGAAAVVITYTVLAASGPANLKSCAGVVKASVKQICGVDLANIKSVSGVV